MTQLSNSSNLLGELQEQHTACGLRIHSCSSTRMMSHPLWTKEFLTLTEITSNSFMAWPKPSRTSPRKPHTTSGYCQPGHQQQERGKATRRIRFRGKVGLPRHGRRAVVVPAGRAAAGGAIEVGESGESTVERGGGCRCLQGTALQSQREETRVAPAEGPLEKMCTATVY